MAHYQSTTTITITNEDLPAEPGLSASLTVGPYQVTINYLTSGPPQPDQADAEPVEPVEPAAPSFVTVRIEAVNRRYIHAARLHVTGTRTRVDSYALCNGLKNTKKVNERLRGVALSEVTCSRCRNHLAQAGIELPPYPTTMH